MEEYRIYKIPEPVLRVKAKRVDEVSERERDILNRMSECMYLSKGVGLAAVQVGIPEQFSVVDTGDGLIMMVNPEIIKASGEATDEEGCLSVPGALVKVKRARSVVVNYIDEEGEPRHVKAEGLLARALQHEIDHLSGRLIVDYMTPIDKLLLKLRKGVSPVRGKRSNRDI